MRPAQFEKKAGQRRGLPQLSQAHACVAGRSLVGVQHVFFDATWSRRGIVTSSLAARTFEVEPMFTVPGFVSGPQPDICGDDIGRTMPQDEPLRLRLGKNHEAAEIRPPMAVEFAAGTPQRSDTRSRPRNAGVNADSSGEIRRSLVSPDGVSLSTALLKSPLRMTAPSFMHRSRMSNRCAVHTDLRLAHSLFMWTLATVKEEHDGSGALRNMPVTTTPSTAHVE